MAWSGFTRDVMDGHFVPNITIGPLIVQAVKRAVPDVKADVHLMISDPARYVDAFAKAGADVLYVHVEADHHLDRLLNRISVNWACVPVFR